MDRDEQVNDIVDLLKTVNRKSTDIDVTNVLLEQRLERGKRSLFREGVPDHADLEEEATDIRVNLISETAPAIETELDTQLAEDVASMALKGMSIGAICKELNNSAIGQIRPFTAYRVRQILQSKECKDIIHMIKATIKDRAQDDIVMHAQKAVERLVRGLDSQNEKVSINCAKELIKLAGVGASEEEVTQKSNAKEAETDQLLHLIASLTGGVK